MFGLISKFSVIFDFYSSDSDNFQLFWAMFDWKVHNNAESATQELLYITKFLRDKIENMTVAQSDECTETLYGV